MSYAQKVLEDAAIHFHCLAKSGKAENGGPLPDCELCGALYASRALRKLGEKVSIEEGLTRYCPKCGHIGEVGQGALDCCPDGSHASYIPEAIAVQARAGFLAEISAAEKMR